MKKDKVSIIVPCYNLEKYIKKTVACIRAQTYKNLEIILIDDGSIDKTPLILDELSQSDDRIKVIHQQNRGVTNARLAGVRLATGDWIGFCDGDDYLEQDMFEHLVCNAKKYSADISHCGYRMVYPSKVDYYYNTGKIIQQNRRKGLKDLLSGEIIEPGIWNKLYRRELFIPMIEQNKMDCSIKNMEDLLMNFYLFSESRKSIYEDFCPYHYVLRKGSAATSKMTVNKIMDPIRVLLEIEKEVKSDRALCNVVEKRLLPKLISASIVNPAGQSVKIRRVQKFARLELFNRFPDVIKGDYSVKTKCLVFMALYLPEVYRWLHTGYGSITGSNRKYDVR